MSGGSFDGAQYHIQAIAEEISRIIRENDDDTLDQWGDPRGRGYTPETISQFRVAVDLLRRADVYAYRIDWLVSGDDSEDTFHERLASELKVVTEK
jgi:hypothetical protein